jgi:hypothetical protein
MSTVRANAILDASGGNTATINSMTPTADSLQGFRNRIINGDMRIDQRNAGAAVTTSSSFPVDRFSIQNSTDGAFSAQQDSSVPAGFVNSVKITATTADGTLTTTQNFQFIQAVEGVNVSDLAWGTANAKTVTLSFWVRSSLTGTFGASLRNSALNRSYAFSYSISVADTWEQKSVTIAGDTSGTWLTTTGVGIYVNFGLGVGPDRSGTAGAWAGANYIAPTGAVSVIGTLNATWYITGVQLEVGSVATPFERRPYGTELQLCQRYFAAYSRAEEFLTGHVTSSSACTAPFAFIQPMRANPTITLAAAGSGSGQIAFLNNAGSTASVIGTNSAVSISSYGFRISGAGYTATGWAAGIATSLYAYSSPTTVISASAEL